MTQPDIYYEESQKNIQTWRTTLKSGINPETGDKLLAVDKQRLRNKISALKSRMSKKTELSDLQTQLLGAKKQFDNLTCVLFDHMDKTQRTKLIKLFDEYESGSEEDKDFEIEKSGLSKKRSKQCGDNKQYFAYRLNQYVGLAR